MISKKILIVSIMISLTSHVLMLYMTNLIEWRGKAYSEDILIVSLKESPEKIEKDNKEEKKEQKPFHRAENNISSRSMQQEDTIDINTLDVKYTPYLKKIKKKIEDIWVYPKAAFEREEEGTAVIKFSISDSGILLASAIVSSSGSNYLDLGALDVVRSAAPYDPFPQEFNLTQLHIVARFAYKLID